LLGWYVQRDAGNTCAQHFYTIDRAMPKIDQGTFASAVGHGFSMGFQVSVVQTKRSVEQDAGLFLS
jgi:hypothetical protein